ncbi:uncharacterized protein LOC135126582 [Zophobas morio]|uniref:uncharacterized protein LOC135126582 n=1 Tax=Zophobas morio TaxID=2755281 RepID=UPI00308341BE
MLWFDKKPYNLRNQAGHKRKAPINTQLPIEKKRLRNFDHINSLPNEILLYIFSFLHIEDLYFNVRPVCTRWHAIAMMSSAWTNVSASRNIPTHIVKRWIQSSPLIKRFKISNRNDADVIVENVAKYSALLESITIEDCWGSPERIYLRSSALW